MTNISLLEAESLDHFLVLLGSFLFVHVLKDQGFVVHITRSTALDSNGDGLYHLVGSMILIRKSGGKGWVQSKA